MASKPQLEKLTTVTSGLLFPTESHVENSCCTLGPRSHPPKAPVAGPPGSTVSPFASALVLLCVHVLTSVAQREFSRLLREWLFVEDDRPFPSYPFPPSSHPALPRSAFHVPHSNSLTLQQPSLS